MLLSSRSLALLSNLFATCRKKKQMNFVSFFHLLLQAVLLF